MKVVFSEVATAGISADVDDDSRRQSAYASLRWYLVRDVPHRAVRHPGFPDRDVYIYALGNTFRVIVELHDRQLIVWSVRGFDGPVLPARR